MIANQRNNFDIRKRNILYKKKEDKERMKLVTLVYNNVGVDTYLEIKKSGQL